MSNKKYKGYFNVGCGQTYNIIPYESGNKRRLCRDMKSIAEANAPIGANYWWKVMAGGKVVDGGYRKNGYYSRFTEEDKLYY